MKCMRLVFLLLAGAALAAMPSAADDKAPVYEQSYVIVIKGGIAGSEKVTETTDTAGNILSSSEHEIFITDRLGTKRMAFSTKMQLAKNTYVPISYSYRYDTGENSDSYEVAVKGGQIKRVLTRNGHTSEATAPLQANTVILDFNVYHTYDYLIRRYDTAKGGRQLFSNFVPLIGNDISLAVTSLGDGELQSAAGSLAVSNYNIEFVGIAVGTLCVDKAGRLVRLVLASQDLEVVRKDMLAANPANSRELRRPAGKAAEEAAQHSTQSTRNAGAPGTSVAGR